MNQWVKQVELVKTVKLHKLHNLSQLLEVVQTSLNNFNLLKPFSYMYNFFLIEPFLIFKVA